MRRAPGHISWNVWIAGAWRQLAIIQGEGLELSELPVKEWTGESHPGRIRFQTFRPRHGEPLTDALIGQGNGRTRATGEPARTSVTFERPQRHHRFQAASGAEARRSRVGMRGVMP
ncbi:MAG: hypothetical protein DME24_00180 [Verrucomicrobia bacterium]|nr:MAG: hypothetical protein DME24_00180 [Verrucomicrobiota bacterium]